MEQKYEENAVTWTGCCANLLHSAYHHSRNAS